MNGNSGNEDLGWASIANIGDLPSPGLVFYPDRIRANITRMLRIAGDPGRLRPHVKTHKTPEIIRLQLEAGISKFKCATIAEAEMTAASGARDILLAYQPVGPNVRRLHQLCGQFPASRFMTIVDCAAALAPLAREFARHRNEIEVLVDIDAGQHRTGIAPGAAVIELCRLIARTPGARFGGLHVYDGHVHAASLAERKAHCAAALSPVWELTNELAACGLEVSRIVAGGTPTFPIHAMDPRVECGPGTCILWDHGYATKFGDLDFAWAALVVTRVISKPDKGRICLDLGNKAVASEGPFPRAFFPALPDARTLVHNEEHMVIETGGAANMQVGDPLLGVPTHICPTTALYADATTVVGGVAGERWRIAARERRLTV